MNPQDGTSQPQGRKLPVIHIVLVASLLALCGAGVWSGRAQSGVEERKFDNTVPEHVPIKVKLKNEQAFKRMGNKDWARDLEVEIKNTGSKPIYFAYMLIVMPEMVNNYGHALTFQISYGRKELVRLTTPIEADDVPIRPGESITLKISESQLKGYEATRHKERAPNPKKVEFHLQLINFGDSTGVQGMKGSTVPEPIRKQSRNTWGWKEAPSASPPTKETRAADSSGQLLKAFYSPLPAKSLRVNFYLLEDVNASNVNSPVPDLCGCQNTGSCFYGVIDYASCPCDDPHQFFAFVSAGTCSNPFAGCKRTITRRQMCQTEYNGEQECTFEEDVENCAIEDPTPTPEATPTPTPTATPAPSPVPCPEPEPNECCICVPPSSRAQPLILIPTTAPSTCRSLMSESKPCSIFLTDIKMRAYSQFDAVDTACD